MDDERRRRLEEEADAALNLSRILREQLRALQPPAGTVPADREQLHSRLDRIQRLTPEWLRAALRPIYLNAFYYRWFPEHSKQPPPARVPLDDARMAWSGYAPFLEYKRRLCRNLSMDLSGISCPCMPGLVSVVLPVFNGERYIAESIESVLAQTHGAFELIIVDDGSHDRTPSIIARYKEDARVRIVTQENRKLPAALNAGFAHAAGEYFTWHSADNRMHPRMLEKLTGFLRANHDAEMVFADEELIDAEGRPATGSGFCQMYQSPPGSNRLRRPRDPGPLSFVQDNYIGGCFLYRAWAARAVGPYCENCFGFEDYDYWLRMNALFRIAHLGEDTALYSYRLHEGSLTARAAPMKTAERTRYFLAQEAERRFFFAASFDVGLAGDHPWFDDLARAYRQSGHNVFRSQVTRAFDKSIAVSEVLRGNRLTMAGHEWILSGPRSLEYPLLAIANARQFAPL